jgi:hypothetical protein
LVEASLSVHLAHCDLTGRQQSPNNMAAVSVSTVWVLVRRFADRFPLAFREPREGEQLVARFLQAIGDRTAFQPPFVDQRLALRLDLQLRAGVDHIVVIGGVSAAE